MRDYPLVGLALLFFGALFEVFAIVACVYGAATADAFLGVLGGGCSVWIAGLWVMVLGGVREDWPAARRKARE